MPKSLVIVESPSKARTIAGFLGDDFVVESSIGHVRDLPRGAAEVPAAYKGEPWARLGVDPDNDFKPLYVVAKEKKSQVAKLKGLLRNAQELYLATDEDREGESIAWHLIEVLAPRVPVKRMVFHEITRAAIRRAVDQWREIDRHLVDAQEARRILDRLYGYEVSPVLWKKVMPRLSAGRVQSVATRILVERERARMRFRAAGWWDLEVAFDAPVAAGRADGPTTFAATLVGVDGLRVATGRDFGETGELKAGTEVVRLDEGATAELVRRLEGASFGVKSVETSPWRSRPYPPFMTSTLQQEASRKLRFGSQRTMQVAQRLYESGYITYMRTDSTTLSETALVAARQQALALYGQRFVPGPLHRSVPGQGPGGAGRGPAVDVRHHHRHRPGPRLRVQEGHGPGSLLHRLRRGGPARAPLPRPDRLRLHRVHGGRPRRDRHWSGGGRPLVAALLLRQRPPRVAVHGLGPSRRDRRARGQLHTDRQRRGRHRDRGARRALRALPAERRRACARGRGPAPGRADRRAGSRAAP